MDAGKARLAGETAVGRQPGTGAATDKVASALRTGSLAVVPVVHQSLDQLSGHRPAGEQLIVVQVVKPRVVVKGVGGGHAGEERVIERVPFACSVWNEKAPH